MNPPTRAVAGDGPDAGQFVSRPPRLPRKAPQCTQPLAPNSPSSAPPRLTLKKEGRKSGGVVQGVLYIDIQELLLLLLRHLQAAASILLFSLLACLLAGRSSWCACLTLGFHCFVSCYCSCSIVCSLVVPVNSLKLHSISRHSFILGIDREQHV